VLFRSPQNPKTPSFSPYYEFSQSFCDLHNGQWLLDCGMCLIIVTEALISESLAPAASHRACWVPAISQVSGEFHLTLHDFNKIKVD
jgi:hypothetical protein